MAPLRVKIIYFMVMPVMGRPDVGSASSFWLYSLVCFISLSPVSFSAPVSSGECSLLFCLIGLLEADDGEMCDVPVSDDSPAP